MAERTVSESYIDQGGLSMVGQSLTLSPDSRRVAYVARASKKRIVVANGLEGEHYDNIENKSLVFSADSQRLAYIARAGKKYLAIVDGQEGKCYDEENLRKLCNSNTYRLDHQCAGFIDRPSR